MWNIHHTHFDLDRRVREIHLPEIHPPQYYQQEKSKKYPRKRRAINPSNMPEIRIMKHDIRRRYGEMLVNVTNNHDLSLVTKFFHEFCRPDCPVIKVTTNHSLQKNIDLILFDGGSRDTMSIKEYIDTFDAFFQMVPNQIIKLQESQVRMRQGSQGSIVLLKVLIKGVKLFTAYPMNENENENDLYHSSSTSEMSSPNRSSSHSFDDTQSSLSSLSVETVPSSFSVKNGSTHSKYYLAVAPVPVEAVTRVAIMMVLDENHIIRQLHAEYRCISETPVFRTN